MFGSFNRLGKIHPPLLRLWARLLERVAAEHQGQGHGRSIDRQEEHRQMSGDLIKRLADARKRMNENPLGAAALAGTSFFIDRHATAKALGFDSFPAWARYLVGKDAHIRAWIERLPTRLRDRVLAKALTG